MSYAQFLHCGDKKSFKSKARTLKAIAKVTQSGWITEGIQPYLCDYCGMWHYGHRKEVNE